MRLSLAASVLALAASPAAAASIKDPICTDRPGINSSTCTVPKGHLQIETGLVGWSLTKGGGVRTDDWEYGSSAIKYGVTDHMHVELDVVPYARSRAREGGTSESVGGFGDAVVKVKQELGGKGGFSAALLPYVKLPTASHRIGNGKVEGGLIVPLAYAIDGTPLSLASSPEIDVVADADGHGYHAGMAQVVGLGMALSDRMSAGVEIGATWDWDEDTTRQAVASGNLAYRLNDNLQIDGQVDLGLNRAASDVALAGGISMRF